MTASFFKSFGQVRIVNLVDRPDRREEMTAQLSRIGALAPNVQYYEARRPSDPGDFPSLGARGCFESHLAVLTSAREAKAESLLLLEDDLDFTRNGRARLGQLATDLDAQSWDFFYGAHVLATNGRRGLETLSPDEAVITASCLGFSRRVISPLVDFLEGILTRPAGSPEYGPMHVDGAYTVFRTLRPEYVTVAAFPTLGRQRSSPSDITPGSMFLDRTSATKPLAALLRRGYNLFRRS